MLLCVSQSVTFPLAVTCCGSRKNMYAYVSVLNPWICQRTRAGPAKIGTWNLNALSGFSFANFDLTFCVGTLDRVTQRFKRRPRNKNVGRGVKAVLMKTQPVTWPKCR